MLLGKKGVIFGVANDMSIAWHIAKACYDNGAQIGLTYLNDALKSRVTNLGSTINVQHYFQCDVSNQESIQNACHEIKSVYKSIDFVVHAIAFSDKNELKNKYVDTSFENFSNTMNISCYSLTAITRHLSEAMPSGSSILTLTYYGAEKVIPNYNVMGVAKAALEASVKYLAVDLGINGIRVNAISSGPVRTLAASGIADFRKMLTYNEKNSPLRRNVTGQDIGNTAVFLLSNLSASITGEIMYVDCGYNITGMQIDHNN